MPRSTNNNSSRGAALAERLQRGRQRADEADYLDALDELVDIADDEDATLTISGTNDQYDEVRSLDLSMGGFLTDADLDDQAKVAVVGGGGRGRGVGLPRGGPGGHRRQDGPADGRAGGRGVALLRRRGAAAGGRPPFLRQRFCQPENA